MEIVITLGLLSLILWKIWPWLGGSPYLPSEDQRVEEIIKLAQVKGGEKVADLGSGNGKLVIALAKAGAEAHGFEINPFLVFYSRCLIKRANLSQKAFIHWQNFYQTDLSSFSLITLFILAYQMKKLEPKLKKELKKGAKVISNHFTFPNWQVNKKVGEVILYQV